MDDPGGIKEKRGLLALNREKYLKIFDCLGEYSLYGLIIGIPISTAMVESFFCFTLLFFLLKKIIRPDFKFLNSPTHIFLLSFFIFMGLSLFNSGIYLRKSLVTLFLKWLENIFIFIIVQDTLSNSKRMRNCLIILLWLACLLGIDGVFQKFAGIDFLRQKKMVPLTIMTQLSGITASFNHNNSFGSYLVFSLSLLLTLLISIKRKLYKILSIMPVALLMVCLFLTFSRGSWMAFVSVLILMLLLSPKSNELIYIFSLFIIMMLFVPEISERVQFIFTPRGDTDRFYIWRGTLKMIKAHPFLGIGVGTYMAKFYTYIEAKLPQYAHNCYLQIWAETGVFSLLSFILFTGSILHKGIKVFKNNSSNFILLGFICALFGFLVHSFFDTLLYGLQLSVLFWFICGFIMAITRLEQNKAMK